MRVISTTDTSRPTFCGRINETVSLVEQFGMYAIIVCRKASGALNYQEISVACTFYDDHDARSAYEDFGGVLK